MSILVVLDINGIVCNKVEKGKGLSVSPYYDIEAIPGYLEFVNKISSTYSIAWYSSTTEKNASRILRILGLFHIPSVFKWYSTEVVNGEKRLDKVELRHPGFKGYVIVDDDIEKIECNGARGILFDNYHHVLSMIDDMANEASTIRDSQE